ncbi:MAG: MFS transporter [Chitinophagaceae bacterium]
MKRILPTIVVAQFLCTSLWFAGNAIMPEIVQQFHLAPSWLAHLTSAAQFGFIAGTFVFALLSISDRFSPSRVFMVSALLASFCNFCISYPAIDSTSLLLCRFLTGFFLAGIYPVGMKIAADYYQQGLGKSLGFLVGALVIGTAFPHLLKSMVAGMPWKYVIYYTSLLAIAGGLLLLVLVPDGPYRKKAAGIRFSALAEGFSNRSFRAAAFGYFGHMWELYAFWVFVPVMLATYKTHHAGIAVNVSLLSFLVIASGGVACVISGFIAARKGAKRTASIALLSSCICCLVSPLLLQSQSVIVLVIFLFCWGMVVIADSPLFSTMVAQNAPAVSKGTSLTIVNCIGFAITIASIQLLNALISEQNAPYIFTLLAIGPVFGLLSLRKAET